MFNGVLLVAIIATWILKVTSLPKLYSQIDTEFRFIKNTLLRNEYPSGFIDKCIKQFLKIKFAPRTPFI